MVIPVPVSIPVSVVVVPVTVSIVTAVLLPFLPAGDFREQNEEDPKGSGMGIIS